MFTFSLRPAILFLVLFLVEVIIALYFHDAFVRPYFGDFLAVIAVYYFIKTFIKISVNLAILLAFVIATVIEVFQYIQILKYINLDKNETVSILVGNSFSWGDMLAYALGSIFVFYFENKISKSIL
jgi:Protein of unknown function (DUF2809)